MNQIHHTRTKIEYVRSNMEHASTQMTKHDSCLTIHRHIGPPPGTTLNA